jgi:hypothetical protein
VPSYNRILNQEKKSITFQEYSFSYYKRGFIRLLHMVTDSIVPKWPSAGGRTRKTNNCSDEEAIRQSQIKTQGRKAPWTAACAKLSSKVEECGV